MRLRRATTTLVAVSAALVGCTSVDSTSPPTVTTTVSPSTSTTEAPAVVVDGVTATEDMIRIGVLADLTGPYSTGVVDVLDAQLAFWGDLNDRGGIDGRRIEVLIEDTGYDTTAHLRAYHRLVDRVVMFSHSTGTEQTVAISDLLVTDHRVAIPLTWYSGWSADPVGTNLLEIGSNYCLEAANTLSYLAGASEGDLDLAVVTVPGDFGADSVVGVRGAATMLDLDVVLDASGELSPDADLVGLARSIAGSGADWTWLAADPSTAVQLVATATQLGYAGGWTGSSPTWNSRLLATQLGPMLAERVVVPSLVAPLGSDVEGMEEVYEVLSQRLPDRYPSEALVVGYLEFEATRRVLEEAISRGDLTPRGVESAAHQAAGLGYRGISPAAQGPGEVVTATGISRFSLDTFEAQDGLAATLSARAITPIEPIAGFASYAVASGAASAATCSLGH